MGDKIIPLGVTEKQYRELGHIVNDLDGVLAFSRPTACMAKALRLARELQAEIEDNTEALFPDDDDDPEPDERPEGDFEAAILAA